jgi:hypothetical protein
MRTTTPTHLRRVSCALVSGGNNSCDVVNLYYLLFNVVSTYSLVAAMIDLKLNCRLQATVGHTWGLSKTNEDAGLPAYLRQLVVPSRSRDLLTAPS